jgi:tetratricopeptide (TPR) repeat protein
MILANFADLNFRRYDYAEVYGRLLMKDVAPGAAFVTSTDDGTVIPMYLQEVKGERLDVKLVHGEFLGVEWYDRRLESQTGLKPAQAKEIAAKTNPSLLYITAFANANVAPGKPVYSERPTDPNGLRPGLSLVPVGAIWKTAVSAESEPTPAGKPDVDPEAVARQRRRARGIYMRHLPTGMVARYEPYEDRLVDLIVQPRLREARPLLELNPGAALGLYERARRIDGALEVDAAFQYDYGLALYLKDRSAEAAEAFEKVLQLEPSPVRETLAHFYLAEISRAAHRPDEAKRHYEAALRIHGADELMMLRIKARAEQP